MNTRKEPRAPRTDAPLSTKLAFVVQFRTGSGGTTKAYSGRVEHMTSGRVAHFRSQAELWTFLERMLTEEKQGSEEWV